MPSKDRSAVGPLYLLACLVLGGSAQGVWQNALLQLAGLAIIAWAASTSTEEPLPGPAKVLLLILAVAIVAIALQLIPLPPSVWNHGSREHVTDGFRILGRPIPALPSSLAPYDTLTTLLCVIPPLAMFCAMTRLRAYRPAWLAAALLSGTGAGILLGTLQLGGRADSPWYLYRQTNPGFAVGFFANANHMADLLVICLPFLAALAMAAQGRERQRRSAILSLGIGGALVILVGIALNGSLAGYALALPVLCGAAIIVLPRSNRMRLWLAALAALALVAAVAGLATSSIGGTRLGEEATTSVQSRQQIFATTGEAITDFMPFGSGLGSFLKVYRLHEHPDKVTDEYVIHAHNDYAELALELGIPGVVLVLAFFAWWTSALWAAWRRGTGTPFARAAAIASAAILVHSLVDYPLRTAAISACFAMCLALLAERSRLHERRDAGELRPARHLVFG